MKAKKIISILICFFLSISITQIFATRDEAESAALATAFLLAASGFDFSDHYELGILNRGRATTFARTLYRGTEYALVTGGCESANDIDLYVYDRNGNLIYSDNDSSKTAVVNFRPNYTGTYYIKVKMYSASSDGVHWCLVYGYR